MFLFKPSKKSNITPKMRVAFKTDGIPDDFIEYQDFNHLNSIMTEHQLYQTIKDIYFFEGSHSQRILINVQFNNGANNQCMFLSLIQAIYHIYGINVDINQLRKLGGLQPQSQNERMFNEIYNSDLIFLYRIANLFNLDIRTLEIYYPDYDGNKVMFSIHNLDLLAKNLMTLTHINFINPDIDTTNSNDLTEKLVVSSRYYIHPYYVTFKYDNKPYKVYITKKGLHFEYVTKVLIENIGSGTYYEYFNNSSIVKYEFLKQSILKNIERILDPHPTTTPNTDVTPEEIEVIERMEIASRKTYELLKIPAIHNPLIDNRSVYQLILIDTDADWDDYHAREMDVKLELKIVALNLSTDILIESKLNGLTECKYQYIISFKVSNIMEKMVKITQLLLPNGIFYCYNPSKELLDYMGKNKEFKSYRLEISA